MLKEVHNWLAQLGMPVSKNYLKLRLESHPYYPSLLSINDTLSELGISSGAFRLTREELNAIGQPFLAHMDYGENDIIHFRSLDEAPKQMKSFEKYWTGVVMVAEYNEGYGNAEYKKFLSNKRKKLNFSIILIVIIFITAFAGIFRMDNLPLTFYILTLNLGLFFSWLIIQKELGINSDIGDKICNLAKSIQCDSVLHSKGAKLLSWLTWGDIGMTYFASMFVFLLLCLSGSTYGIIYIFYLFSIIPIVFPIFSIYYQWRIIKQWCSLCIGVLGVLLLNATISLIILPDSFKSLTQNSSETAISISVFTIFFSTLLLGWQHLKDIYYRSLTSISNEIRSIRLKRNPDIFNGLIKQDELSVANVPKQGEAILYGNHQAPYKIVMACNPYCGPCRQAHSVMDELFDRYPDKLCVSVRFALINNHPRDGNVQAASEIFKVAKKNPYTAIKSWFEIYDINKYRKTHAENKSEISNEVDRHALWSKENAIRSTPTFFFNGRRVSGIYNWKEFLEILDILIQG